MMGFVSRRVLSCRTRVSSFAFEALTGSTES